MAGFGKTDGPQSSNEDIIVIHLGRILSEEQFERVQKSVIAFMNARWPDWKNVGVDS